MLIVALWCWVAIISSYDSLPGAIFRKSFGFEPTADVRIMDSSKEMVIDWNVTHLDFCADQSTIDRIVARGFTRASAADIVQDDVDLGMWMILKERGDDQIYTEGFSHKEPSIRHFPHQVLIFRRSSREAFYYATD
jgi:hypothetical protein